MVDFLGRWTAEENYGSYPEEKWCDMDYVANYINTEGYTPKTSIENVAEMVVAHFEGEVENENSEFQPAYGDNLMINIDNLSAFVEASGGLREFDYHC